MLNDSNVSGVININGGTYISNDITIMNVHDGKINISDKNGKVYLTKDYETHNKVILDLKNKGLWFEW